MQILAFARKNNTQLRLRVDCLGFRLQIEQLHIFDKQSCSHGTISLSLRCRVHSNYVILIVLPASMSLENQDNNINYDFNVNKNDTEFFIKRNRCTFEKIVCL